MSAGKNGAAASHSDGCILMRRNQQEKKAMGTIVLWCRTFFCVLDTHTHMHAQARKPTEKMRSPFKRTAVPTCAHVCP